MYISLDDSNFGMIEAPIQLVNLASIFKCSGTASEINYPEL
jgi:hypothetical protein